MRGVGTGGGFSAGSVGSAWPEGCLGRRHTASSSGAPGRASAPSAPTLPWQLAHGCSFLGGHHARRCFTRFVDSGGSLCLSSSLVARAEGDDKAPAARTESASNAAPDDTAKWRRRSRHGGQLQPRRGGHHSGAGQRQAAPDLLGRGRRRAARQARAEIGQRSWLRGPRLWRLRADSAGARPDAKGVVRLHIESPKPVQLHEHIGTSAVMGPYGGVVVSHSRVVCESPCDQLVDARRGQRFVVAGDGVPASEPFQLHAQRGDVKMNVDAGSSGRRAGGVLLTSLGAAGVAYGVLGLVLGAVANDDASTRDLGEALQTSGGISLGAGVATLAGGIVLIATSRTRIDFARGAAGQGFGARSSRGSEVLARSVLRCGQAHPVRWSCAAGACRAPADGVRVRRQAAAARLRTRRARARSRCDRSRRGSFARWSSGSPRPGNCPPRGGCA